MDLQTLQIQPSAEKRLKAGHLWVYANEVVTKLKSFAPGEWVNIVSTNGHPMGTGYVNPHSLIAVRLVTRRTTGIDKNFMYERIERAINRRKSLLNDMSVGRMVYGESDGLPGLVVDRYDRYVVVQVLTAGMERKLEEILDAVDGTLSPDAVILRNDASSRKLEGLELTSRIVRGSARVNVTIEEIRYELDLLDGQKTGFFLDQRFNHTLTRGRVDGKRVLDMFSYVGAWSLQAGRSGASYVLGIDSSTFAVESSRRHAVDNGLTMCEFRQADAFDALKSINDAQETFDVIILDPPAFAKSRAEVKDAIRGYREINRRAAKALTDGGMLVTCSCSHVIEPETFRNTVLQAVTSAGRNAWLIEQRSQSPDHPILLSMRETEYLKCLVLKVAR
jgi:23S rRNA (cytosine1962-C5)-methyltransferase